MSANQRIVYGIDELIKPQQIFKITKITQNSTATLLWYYLAIHKQTKCSASLFQSVLAVGKTAYENAFKILIGTHLLQQITATEFQILLNPQLSQYTQYSVYLLTFPNGYRYVGITSMEPTTRWNNGMGYSLQPKIFTPILNFGWENVQKEIIYQNLTKEEALNKEKELIQIYDSISLGYNSIY